jgi:hypothetical protein
MNVFGTVLTLTKNNETGLWDCHFGRYQDDVEVILPVKLLSNLVSANQVLFIAGLVQRNQQTKGLWVDAKDFTVLAKPVEGMVLNSFLNIHGLVESESSIISSNWHWRDIGMSGNFQSTFQKRENDPRPVAAVGTLSSLNAKIIGLYSDQFVVEVINFEHCGTAKTVEGTPKRIKLGVTLPTTPKASPKLVLKNPNKLA